MPGRRVNRKKYLGEGGRQEHRSGFSSCLCVLGVGECRIWETWKEVAHRVPQELHVSLFPFFGKGS